MEKMSIDFFDVKCNKCQIHCIKDHAILLAENLKLKEQNLELKKQIATLQLDQQEKKLTHGTVITNNLTVIDQCELILKNQAYREINKNLMLSINDLKSENKSLKSRMTDLETNMRNITKIVYKFAAKGFISVIEKMLLSAENQTAEEIEYLKLLKEYFSSFARGYVSNIIEPDCDEMNEWVKAMFNKSQIIDQEYVKCSKKIKITLKKSVLDNIVKFCQENQNSLTETEAAE